MVMVILIDFKQALTLLITPVYFNPWASMGHEGL